MIGELLAFLGSAIFLGAQASKETVRKIENQSEMKKIESIGLNVSRQVDVNHLFYSIDPKDQEKAYNLVKNSKCDCIGKDEAIAEFDKVRGYIDYTRQTSYKPPKISDFMLPKHIDLCVWVVAKGEGWVVDKMYAPNAPTGYDYRKSYGVQKMTNQF